MINIIKDINQLILKEDFSFQHRQKEKRFGDDYNTKKESVLNKYTLKDLKQVIDNIIEFDELKSLGFKISKEEYPNYNEQIKDLLSLKILRSNGYEINYDYEDVDDEVIKKAINYYSTKEN